jgi:AAA15 family ATPase/GTPase
MVDCTFGKINLIVGKNATGKTRALNVIRSLAQLVSERGKRPWSEGNYNVTFKTKDQTIKYELSYSGRKVLNEVLEINSKTMLQRGPDSTGVINAKELQRNIKFQTPIDEVAVAAREDSVQHPFLESLHKWGKNLIRYDFSTPLGKDHLALPESRSQEIVPDLRESDKVIEIFNLGLEKLDDSYKQIIIKDMGTIGYEIEDIEVSEVQGLKFSPQISGPPFGLHVKEKSMKVPLSQVLLSQGMFRALSILIQINYVLLKGSPSCILIDDIGEGLDYERSSSLVKLIINKAKEANVQLIMATNDSFIMNNVPIEYWIILHCEGGKSIHFNYRNSKKIFDDFELTGLNNFDLFTSKYFLTKIDNQG